MLLSTVSSRGAGCSGSGDARDRTGERRLRTGGGGAASAKAVVGNFRRRQRCVKIGGVGIIVGTAKLAAAAARVVAVRCAPPTAAACLLEARQVLDSIGFITFAGVFFVGVAMFLKKNEEILTT